MLKPTMELERARMKLRLSLPAREARRIREKISKNVSIEQEDWTPDLEIVSPTQLGCVAWESARHTPPPHRCV